MTKLFAILAGFVGVTMATADLATAEMSQHWREQRARTVALSNAACNGDADAFQELRMLSFEGHATAMVSFAWLLEVERCGYGTKDFEFTTSLQRQAADQGYPIAQSNLAMRMIQAMGMPRQIEGARELVLAAMQGGYPRAGAFMAKELIYGKNIAQDLDEALRWTIWAHDLGAPLDILADVRQRLTTAERTAGRTPSYDANGALRPGITADPFNREAALNPASARSIRRAVASASPASAPSFAAVAIDRDRGNYGFAHDFATEDEAVAEARRQCQVHGGQNCWPVLSLSGPGCMAYRYELSPATVYGWGVSPDRSVAQQRAAAECRSRNDANECSNHAWSCNVAQSDSEVQVLYEAENPMPTATAGGETCPAFVRMWCWGLSHKDSYTYKVGNQEKIGYYSTIVDSVGGMQVSFPGCGQANRFTELLERLYLKNTDYWDSQVPADAKASIEATAESFRSQVMVQYPACRATDLKVMIGPGYSDVSGVRHSFEHGGPQEIGIDYAGR